MTKRFLALLLLLGLPTATRAQVAPDSKWRTLRTEHFRITFESGLEALARRAAELAEAAHARLAAELGPPPGGTIDLVLSDNVDYPNGLATPFPSNRLYIYTRPPVGHPTLSFTHDWLETVIVHELTHLFHMDRTGPLGSALRRIFGRVPTTWPLFPAVFTPQWSIEGLATYFESRLTGTGRVYGPMHEMMARTAILEGAWEELDEMNGTSPTWPDDDRPYVFGSLFMDYLARTYGPEVHRELLAHTAGAPYPPSAAFNRVARAVIGRSFNDAYRDWRRELEARYARLADSLRAEGITASERLPGGGRFTLFPRISPDGRRIAFVRSDGRDDPVTRVLDPETGRARDWRRNQVGELLGPASWLPDGRALVTAQFENDGPYRLYQDLYLLDENGEHRLTRGARLAEPDVAPDGRRVMAVQSQNGATRLVIYDLETGAIRPVTDFRPEIGWSLPRWSPDGTRIAVSVWREGASHDIVVLDTTGVTLLELTRDLALDGAPAWSPDGRYILFWSDRSGIPNLYAYDLHQAAADSALRQVTSVLTGAFYPEVSPDGRWIYFTGYHADGFHIERIPFDPSSWRAPAPLRPLPAPARTAAGNPDPGPARSYSPLGSLRPRYWLPSVATSAELGTFYGFTTGGQDLVGRHAYDLEAMIGREGRLEGGVGYRNASLGNPVLGAFVGRTWNYGGAIRLEDGSTHDVVYHEDELGLSATFSRTRWRSSASLRLGAEYVARNWLIEGQPPGVQLLDPEDRLAGLSARLTFGNHRSEVYSISPEAGVNLLVAGRRRWDLRPSSVRDGTYSEASAWGTAYRDFRAFGFADHVLAARLSALWRTGPGADPAEIGGASSDAGPALLFGTGLLGASRFLPVRGFPAGVRAGTRAWTASLEYRFPVALVGRRFRPFPLFVDRLDAAAFLDAGNAWCTGDEERRFADCRDSGVPAPAPGTSLPRRPTLVAAGVELGIRFGTPLHLRGGFGFPLQGPGNRPVWYLHFGPGF